MLLVVESRTAWCCIIVVFFFVNPMVSRWGLLSQCIDAAPKTKRENLDGQKLFGLFAGGILVAVMAVKLIFKLCNVRIFGRAGVFWRVFCSVSAKSFERVAMSMVHVVL